MLDNVSFNRIEVLPNIAGLQRVKLVVQAAAITAYPGAGLLLKVRNLLANVVSTGEAEKKSRNTGPVWPGV